MDKNLITKKQLESILDAIETEGFDYCFRHYSSFNKITDKDFRLLYNQYIKAAKDLEEYLEKQGERLDVEVEF